ncbi:hypothetical protein ACGF5O_38845 [Streptomyces sp. NPDC048291]|uniref:hypothetical protein n=1 Tax=Streptomyces sp. NPDC048291 TaxID=3365530 RepID=UPI00371B9453
MVTVGWVSVVTAVVGGVFLVFRYFCNQLVGASRDLIRVIRAFRKVREELTDKSSKLPTAPVSEEMDETSTV